MNKRVLVNLCIVLVLAVIGYFCYITGKAYNVIVENVQFVSEGKTYVPLEAVQVTVDKQPEPVYLLDGDRLVSTVVGLSHTLKIEILDDEDKTTETISVPFEVKDLIGPQRILNVPYFYEKALKAKQ